MPVHRVAALPLFVICKQIWLPRAIFYVEQGSKMHNEVVPSFGSYEPFPGTPYLRCNSCLWFLQMLHNSRSWVRPWFEIKCFGASDKSDAFQDNRLKNDHPALPESITRSILLDPLYFLVLEKKVFLPYFSFFSLLAQGDHYSFLLYFFSLQAQGAL